jgi:demethylmenaquinone methyltransferase/2-methoxy-6-polyprenyl-1,4-benzoquinol methylase
LATAEPLPDYARMLSAYQGAFERELREMIGSLPIAEEDWVLEVACGDGVYARWLADRVGPRGEVVAVDISDAFLEIAHDQARHSPKCGQIRFVQGDVEHMPFSNNAFDFAWCAQSLYSLPDPVESLRRMARVVRPGGVVAVLENDALHHILLPWTIEMELAIHRAELHDFKEESSKPRKYYIGRQLCQSFREAGLVNYRKRTWASNRQAPLGPLERAFFDEYLLDLRDRVAPHLEPSIRDKFERLVDPKSGQYMLDCPDLAVTCIDHVVWGFKPEG